MVQFWYGICFSNKNQGFRMLPFRGRQEGKEVKLSRSGFNPLERTSRRVHLQTGFTLAELMTVLAIVAILATVGGIALNSQMPQYRLKGDARSVTSSLMLARMKATSGSQQYAIEFDLDATPQTYRLRVAGGAYESYSRELSGGVNIESVNGTSSGTVQIIYNPNGSSSAGDIRLRLGTLTDGYQILLTPTTGRVQTIKGWP